MPSAFSTPLIKATTARPELELLTDWQEIMTIPCAAIGGITVDNCAPLIAAGRLPGVVVGRLGIPRRPQRRGESVQRQVRGRSDPPSLGEGTMQSMVEGVKVRVSVLTLRT